MGEEKIRNNKSIGLILLLVGFVLIGVGCFLGFGKGDNNSTNGNNNGTVPTPTPVVSPTPTPSNENYDDNYDDYVDDPTKTGPNWVKIGKNNNQVKFNGKTIKIKTIGNDIYVDDKIIGSVGSNQIVAGFVGNDFILLEAAGQNYTYPYAITKNNKIVEVEGNPDSPFCGIYDLEIVNNKVVGVMQCGEEEGDTEDKIEFVSSEKKITIKQSSNKSEPTPQSNEGLKKNSEWIEYLLKQNELQMTVIRNDCDNPINNKKINLTSDQIEEFLNKLKSNEVIDYIMDGTGDTECGEYITASYKLNNKEESLEIDMIRLWAITDTGLYDVLKNSDIKKDYSGCSDKNNVCYSGYYGFKNDIDFSSYLK